MPRSHFNQGTLNFLLTNRIPRRFATTLAGRIARIESRWLTRVGMAIWQAFGGSLELHEAATEDFTSLQSVFIRRLRPGARVIDQTPDVLVSPCDAIVGAHGVVTQRMAIQAKGISYSLQDLLVDPALVERHEGGCFVTLRLRSTMYHRFHAPCDGRVRSVIWINGDTWNVNPPALRRVHRLFCQNERVVIDVDPVEPHAAITLVAVAAILVASVHLECLPTAPRATPHPTARYACDYAITKGQELGHFKNGSTILLFASHGLEFCPAITEGATVRFGEPLLRRKGVRFPMRSDYSPSTTAYQ